MKGHKSKKVKITLTYNDMATSRVELLLMAVWLSPGNLLYTLSNRILLNKTQNMSRRPNCIIPSSVTLKDEKKQKNSREISLNEIKSD